MFPRAALLVQCEIIRHSEKHSVKEIMKENFISVQYSGIDLQLIYTLSEFEAIFFY